MRTVLRRATRPLMLTGVALFLGMGVLGGGVARAVIVGPYPNGECVNTDTNDFFVCVGPPPLAICHDPNTGITSACGAGAVQGPGLPFPDPNYSVPPSQYVSPSNYVPPSSMSHGNGSSGHMSGTDAVPEPGWCVLMAAGGLPMGLKLLRRRFLKA